MAKTPSDIGTAPNWTLSSVAVIITIMALGTAFGVRAIVKHVDQSSFKRGRENGFQNARAAFEGMPVEVSTLQPGNYRVDWRFDNGYLALVSQIGPHGDFPIIVRNLPENFTAGRTFKKLTGGRLTLSP